MIIEDVINEYLGEKLQTLDESNIQEHHPNAIENPLCEDKLFIDHTESTEETIYVEEKEDEVVLDAVECNSEDQQPIDVVGFDSTKYFTTDKTFSSKENVTEWCREIGSQNNIVVVIKKRVNKNENHGGKGSAIVFGCERGGKYRKRNYTVIPSKCRKGTGTKKCGCPFKLRSSCVDASKWNLIVKVGRHNHLPADTLLGHSFAGRLSEEEKNFVIKFHEHGLPPRQILIALRDNFKKNRSTLKTIDNCIQKHRVSERAGRTRMQLLHKYLDDSHYVTWNRQNSDTCEVTDIFWAHPESTLCAQCFPSVVIIDCTYKTNRWKMPLFHAAGMTSMGTTFSIAFAFMSAELTENYTWALQHLRSLYSPTNLPSVIVTDNEQALINGIGKVFPDARRLLCTWHIQKNVYSHFRESTRNEKIAKELKEKEKNSGDGTILKKAKRKVNKEAVEEEEEDPLKDLEDDWRRVVRMETISLFNMGLESFVRKYEKRYPEAIRYIYESVLVNKEFFAYAWTNEVKHFGTRTSNRVEGAHSVLKRFLGNSQGGFVECWQQMHKMHESQLVTIKANFQQTLTFIKHEHRIDDFKSLHCHVSQYALNFIISEIRRLEKSRSIAENLCGCILHKTHGLPCAHMISEYRNQGKPIPLSSIDSQWRQLNLVPHVSRSNAGFDYLPQLEILRTKWENSTDAEKSRINELVTIFVTGIAQPDKNNFQEPPAPVRTKGRKTAAEKKKEAEENSCQRDLSRHEHADLKKKVPPVVPGSTNTQEQPGNTETYGSKQKRKYTKKNSEYWGKKKTKTETSEAFETKKDEMVIHEGMVRTEKFDVAENVVEDRVKDLVVVTEECTSNTEKLVTESRNVIDFTLECSDERTDHDIPVCDVEAIMNNQEEEEEEEEEEDYFAEDKLEDDEDAWQLQRWREPRPEEWNLPNPSYVSQLPEAMQFYIEGTQYVLSDGHCGFHSIAFQLGLPCSDDFRYIRNNMHAEVFNHKTFYEKVLYSEERLNNMLKRLRFDDGDEMDISKWFKMPEDGLVAAQTFRAVLVWLSKDMCATFFPSRHGPIKGKKHRVIVMAFVGGNHFVPMKLKLGAPIPPPCNMWIQNAYEDAKVWPKKYEEKMKTFKKRMNFRDPQPEKPVIIH